MFLNPLWGQLFEFVVHKIIPIEIDGIDFSFTNSSLSMLISSLIILTFSFLAVRKNIEFCPTRLQIVLKITYQFVMSTLCNSAGPRSKSFFPFVFSLFVFLTTANLLGMFPVSFLVLQVQKIVFITITLQLLR
ncbi:hypothetical protein AYJ09_04735 [Candidatus Liberibacter solanacearum]|uniref:F0F1 ATP synthase subunit A n=1 Tax=Candidatus Liberibacter solanacearum TaxID=556287 RepID=UPI000978E5A4|nr:F0F1 ATP synthase subunit A [Candidatus Liberibacter solanacearum]ONI58687.1 hypothetical protein AYJ09_04735 [Candidatus Liberibacter solanacearum]